MSNIRGVLSALGLVCLLLSTGCQQEVERSAVVAAGSTFVAPQSELGMTVLENAAGQYVAPLAESFLLTLSESELPADFRLAVPDPPPAGAYPLVTLAWALVLRHVAASGRDPGVIDFLEWFLLNGQRYASQTGYAGLPRELFAQCVTALG